MAQTLARSQEPSFRETGTSGRMNPAELCPQLVRCQDLFFFFLFETVCSYVAKRAWNLLCSYGLASIWILLCPAYPVLGLQVCTTDAKYPRGFLLHASGKGALPIVMTGVALGCLWRKSSLIAGAGLGPYPTSLNRTLKSRGQKPKFTSPAPPP